MAASLQGDIKSMIKTSFSQLVYLFQAEGQDIVFYIVSDPCAGHLIKVLLYIQMYILVNIGAHISWMHRCIDAFV